MYIIDSLKLRFSELLSSKLPDDDGVESVPYSGKYQWLMDSVFEKVSKEVPEEFHRSFPNLIRVILIDMFGGDLEDDELEDEAFDRGDEFEVDPPALLNDQIDELLSRELAGQSDEEKAEVADEIAYDLLDLFPVKWVNTFLNLESPTVEQIAFVTNHLLIFEDDYQIAYPSHIFMAMSQELQSGCFSRFADVLRYNNGMLMHRALSIGNEYFAKEGFKLIQQALSIKDDVEFNAFAKFLSEFSHLQSQLSENTDALLGVLIEGFKDPIESTRLLTLLGDSPALLMSMNQEQLRTLFNATRKISDKGLRANVIKKIMRNPYVVATLGLSKLEVAHQVSLAQDVVLQEVHAQSFEGPIPDSLPKVSVEDIEKVVQEVDGSLFATVMSLQDDPAARQYTCQRAGAALEDYVFNDKRSGDCSSEKEQAQRTSTFLSRSSFLGARLVAEEIVMSSEKMKAVVSSNRWMAKSLLTNVFTDCRVAIDEAKSSIQFMLAHMKESVEYFAHDVKFVSDDATDEQGLSYLQVKPLFKGCIENPELIDSLITLVEKVPNILNALYRDTSYCESGKYDSSTARILFDDVFMKVFEIKSSVLRDRLLKLLLCESEDGKFILTHTSTLKKKEGPDQGMVVHYNKSSSNAIELLKSIEKHYKENNELKKRSILEVYQCVSKNVGFEESLIYTARKLEKGESIGSTNIQTLLVMAKENEIKPMLDDLYGRIRKNERIQNVLRDNGMQQFLNDANVSSVGSAGLFASSSKEKEASDSHDSQARSSLV